MKARYKEDIVEVIKTNNGWSTIQFVDGMQRKVRSSELVEMIEERIGHTLAGALNKMLNETLIEELAEILTDENEYKK